MNIGDKIPEILGKDAEGNIISMKDFPGKKFIIYFYPKDNTAGCSAEACSIRDGWKELSDMGYQVIGVSKDSEASHRKFADKYSLPFPLVADTEHQLCEQFGVWQLKKMAGREYWGIVRTTFVADENGVVTDIIRKVKTKDAAGQLFALLDGRDNPNPA
ncbi:MAG: thioredoxin-dependent thiol peroxidase [Prevotella sp.]|nr:thioredoxin-dependent thiol peroxidase [Bacteroides sp.]MCM1366100.1 thioredoxin-dependent thiol peroxidase [Prevotella sp.]MCM1436585.1 thioredoxin-dependent thiol peroxidase [Prevotella sp.]